MAVNINQLNPQALAQLASQGIGSLNLPNYGVDVGGYETQKAEGLFKQAGLRKDYAQMAAETARQNSVNQTSLFNNQANNQGLWDRQINSQGFTGEQNDLTRQQDWLKAQQEAEFKQQQLAETASYHQGTLGVDRQNSMTQKGQLQAQIAKNMQDLQVSQMRLAFDERKEMTEEKRRLRGGMGVGILDLLEKNLAPEVETKMLGQMVDTAVAQGVISAEHGQQIKSAPRDSISSTVMADIAVGAGVDAMVRNEKGRQGILNPQDATKSNVDKAQQEVMDQNNIISIVDKMDGVSKQNPNLGTNWGSAADRASTAYGRNPSVGANPIIQGVLGATASLDKESVKKTAADAKLYNSYRTQLKAEIGKNLSSKLLTNTNPLLDDIIPDLDRDDPEDLRIKQAAAREMAVRIRDTASNYLSQGINPATSPQAGKEIQNIIQETRDNLYVSPTKSEEPKAPKDMSDSELKAFYLTNPNNKPENFHADGFRAFMTGGK